MQKQGPTDEMWMEALDLVGKRLESPKMAEALREVDRILDEAEAAQ